MKLRIANNSLRLRLTQTDVRRFIAEGHIESTVFFAPGAHLTYALAHRGSLVHALVEPGPQCVSIIVPSAQAQDWAASNTVGIYAKVDSGHGPLDLLIEKDFACLDGDDPVDPDAFPNPKFTC